MLHEAEQDRVERIRQGEAACTEATEKLQASSELLMRFEEAGEPDAHFYDHYSSLLEKNTHCGELLSQRRADLDKIREICNQRVSLAKRRIEPPVHCSETATIRDYVREGTMRLEKGSSVWFQRTEGQPFALGTLSKTDPVHEVDGVQSVRICCRLPVPDEEAVLETVFYDQQFKFRGN